jgi:hypothetical protein
MMGFSLPQHFLSNRCPLMREGYRASCLRGDAYQETTQPSCLLGGYSVRQFCQGIESQGREL